MPSKRGDIAFKYLILVILALVVLILVLIFFSRGYNFLFDKIKWAVSFIFDLGPKGM